MKKTLKKLFKFTLSLFAVLLSVVLLQFGGAFKFETSFADAETTLTFENAESSHAKVLVDGEEISDSNQIQIVVGSTHSVQAVPNKYYQNMIVYIFNDDQYNDYLNPETNTNYTVTNAMLNVDSAKNFTFAESSPYHIVVETKEIDYNVKLSLVDDKMQSRSDLSDDDYFTVNKNGAGFVAKVKIGDTVTNGAITSKNLDSHDWKFVCFKVKNQNTGAFEEVELDYQFSESDLDKYLEIGDNGRKILNIFAVFTKLFKVQVSADLENYGRVLVFVNSANMGYVDMTSNYTQNGVFTYYVTNFDKVKIIAMPNVGKCFDGFYLTSAVNISEISGNICELKEFDQDIDVVVKFGDQKYAINFVAVDENKQVLNNYSLLTKFYINNKEGRVVKFGDKINTIKTTEMDSKTYKLTGYEIYSKVNGWVKLSASNNDVNSNFIADCADNNNTIYIRACYVKTFKISIKLEETSTDCGYFYLFIIRNSDNKTTLMTGKITSFEDYIDSGYTVMIQADANVGYQFAGYTLENGGANKNIFTKTISDDLDIGLIFDKAEVELNVSVKADKTRLSGLSSNVVKVGDKVAFTFKTDFGNTIKKISINDVDVKKLENVEVTENAVIIEVTSEFLKSLKNNSVYEMQLSVETGIDGGDMVAVILLPIILAGTVVGSVVFLVLFLKAKKRLQLAVQRDIKEF